MVQRNQNFWGTAVGRRLHRIAGIMLIGILLPACAGSPPPSVSMPEDIRETTYYARKAVKLFRKGCYAGALDYFQDAHERYAAADQLEGVAHSLNGIADIYHRWGEIQSAVKVYDDVIEIYQSLDDSQGVIQVLCNKSAALIALDRLETAAEILRQADALDRSGNQTPIRLRTRALLSIRKNEPQLAREQLDQALAAAEADQPMQSSIFYAKGHVELTADRPAQAKVFFGQALHLDRAAGAYHDIARDLQSLGTCHARLGDHRQALNHFKRSAKIFALLKDQRRATEVIEQLEKSARRAGADIQTTLQWIHQWMLNPNDGQICD